jgi:hypothetical protein
MHNPGGFERWHLLERKWFQIVDRPAEISAK